MDDFEAFFARNYGPVLRTVTLAVGDHARAEDAVQEAFARAYRRWRSVSAMERPVAWIHVVAVNVVRKDWRRADRIADGHTDDPSLAHWRRRYQRLAAVAPSASLRRAVEAARPYVVAGAKYPPAHVRPALRMFDRALADHCGRSFLDVFKIGYAFLTTPTADAGVSPVDLGVLQPTEMVSTDDRIWLVSQRSEDPQDGCELARVDPLTGATSTTPLPTSAFNGVAGDDGALYFETATIAPDSLTHEIRIVKVDAATGAAQTLDPIAMRVEGTASGHTQLAYADGSLWLWGTVEGSSEIHEVSTQTGEVERVITNAPAIGGTEPVMAATPGQLWLAGGPGVPPTLARLDTTTGSLTNGPSLAADAPGTVEWLASRGNEVDVGVLGTGLTGTTPRSHIVAVATDGSVLHNVEVDDVGGQVVATSGTLWTLMASSHCEHIVLSWIDTSTFTPVRIHSFPGSAPCTASGPRHLAAVGPHVFVLDQGLYRVTL